MASSHIARVTAGGVSDRRIAHSLYGYCTTASSVAAKQVNLYTGSSTASDGSWSNSDLFHGLTIKVRFQQSNTASNATLNVNNSGAKSLYVCGTEIGTDVQTSWQAQEIISLTYDTVLKSDGCWVVNRSRSKEGGVSSYHNTASKSNGNTITSYTLNHYLDTKDIIISVLINNGTNEFLATQGTFSTSEDISYAIKIIDQDMVQVIFNPNTAWSNLVGTISFSVISTHEYSVETDDIFLKVN